MNQINNTRFQSAEEFAANFKEIDLGAKHYETAGIPLLVRDNKVYVDDSDSHSLIFGATGSKKTRLFVFPSVEIFCRAGESFVATDPKGEIYNRTKYAAEENGYDVVCLNLRDFDAGDAWNPFMIPYKFYHGGNRTKAMEMLTECAKMIVGEDSEEAFWTNSAIDMLLGFILVMFENCSEENCNIRSLLELWSQYQSDKREFARKVRAKYHGKLIESKLNMISNPSDKTTGSIEAFVSMGLNKFFINEEAIDFLSRTSINLMDMVDKKVAIYLIIPDENRSYHFIASLLLEQLYEVLIRAAQSLPGTKLNIRMNFLIDEFANIPRLDNMEAMISAARSRNIRFHLVIQSLNQMKQKYGNLSEVIYSNCNNWIYLYSKEYELLEMISRLCGEVVYENNITIPLISGFELQHLSKKDGQALILAGRGLPFISSLMDIDDYPFV